MGTQKNLPSPIKIKGGIFVIKNKNRLLALAGFGAVLGYRAIKGYGSFNKIRFKKPHRAVENYVNTHFPGAKIGEIYPSAEGYRCVILHNNSQILIYLIPTESGGFIFTQM